MAIEVDRADAKGMNKVRAYVCDGRGEPAGMAIWFAGAVDAAATTQPGTSATLTSAGGNEDLVLEYVAGGRVQGSFKDERGARRQFAAYPAIDGAGIYEVSLDQALHYTGTSTDGNTLDATADDGGRTSGTIKTAGGQDGGVHRPEPRARHARAAERARAADGLRAATRRSTRSPASTWR